MLSIRPTEAATSFRDAHARIDTFKRREFKRKKTREIRYHSEIIIRHLRVFLFLFVTCTNANADGETDFCRSLDEGGEDLLAERRIQDRKGACWLAQLAMR